MSPDSAEEHRRRELHKLERATARQPGTGPGRPDKITVVRIVLAAKPDRETYVMMRWSLAKRMIRDAGHSGDQLTDLGPDALLLCQAAQRGDFGRGEMVLVGVARDGKWLRWFPPAPREPVPGTPGQAASRN